MKPNRKKCTQNAMKKQYCNKDLTNVHKRVTDIINKYKRKSVRKLVSDIGELIMEQETITDI